MAKLLHPRNKFPVLYRIRGDGKIQEWKIFVEDCPKEGCPVIVIVHGVQGGQPTSTRSPVRQGKNKGRSNATTPVQQALAEATSRHTEQIERQGYRLEAEESAGVRGAMPMLAQKYKDVIKDPKKIDWKRAFAQPKLDGFRCLARKVGGKVTLVSRKNKAFTAPSHIAEAVAPYLENGETFDGELYCHGMALATISSACNRKSENTERLCYHVYDFPAPSSFPSRYELLQSRLKEAPGCISVVKTAIVTSAEELAVVEGAFRGEGYEGAMLRHGSAGYESGKRSLSLLKVKTFVDDEFKVVDAKPGRGPYEGMAIFTCETSDGHPFDVTSPGTHEEKRRYLAEAGDYVGRMLTVAYAYYTQTAEPVPFQPVAKGFFDE